MQKWKCHKVVEAFKITGAKTVCPLGDDIHRLFGHGIMITVERAYMLRNPHPIGGYYVKYRDGYESWSPAREFEDGYTKLDERPSSSSSSWWRRILNAVS